MTNTDNTATNLKDRLTADVKTSMLAGDKARTEVLRGLKSVILYAEVAAGNREAGGLDDAAVLALFAKESKKRQESAALYTQGGSAENAAKELSEKAIIDEYLPAELSEDDIRTIVHDTMAELGLTEKSQMGQAIAAVKQRTGAAADGAVVARLVKEHFV